MHLPHFKKKFIAAGLAAGLVMGAGGIAAAWFTSTGSGFGAVHVATAKGFTVTQLTSGTTIGPGGTTLLTFNVHNNANFNQHFTHVVFHVTRTTGFTGVTTMIRTYTTTTIITGCDANWFTMQFDTAGVLTATPATIGTSVLHPTTIGPTGTLTLTFVLGMITSGTNQNVCQGHLPQVYVEVS